MKTLLTLLLSWIGAMLAQAQPFLEADAVAVNANNALNAVTYTLTGNLPGSPITLNATSVTPGGVPSIQLIYNLNAVPSGTYTVQAYATNSQGESSQPSAPPFSFSLFVPPTPQNLKITPTQ